MKVKLVQFYRDQIQPKLAALKAIAIQLKQRAGAWLARQRRRLWQVAAVAATLTVVVIAAVVWRRSPALRATVKGLAAAEVGLLAGLWTLFRGPAEIPVPVAVTEQPPVEIIEG